MRETEKGVGEGGRESEREREEGRVRERVGEGGRAIAL